MLACAPLAAALPAKPGGNTARSAVQPDSPLGALASCVREKRKLAVLVLMDTSGSLRSSDPHDIRVAAAKAAVDGLSLLVDKALNSPPIAVSIALGGFDHQVTVGDWRELRQPPTEIKEDIAGFRDRNVGNATDYVAALDGAREVLAKRAGAGGRPACQALLWFTDGKYEPNGEASTEAQVKAGITTMCAPNGVVDQLRNTGAALLTVALNNHEDRDDRLDEDDERLLRSIAGVEPGCGERRSALGGNYISVDHAQELIDAFSRMTDPAEPGPLCRGDDRDLCTFELEPLLKSFYVLIHTGEENVTVHLQPPGVATGLELTRPGTDSRQPVAGANLRWAWFDDQTLAVTGELPAASVGEWRGTWQVTTSGNNNRPADGSVSLYGNLEQRITAAPHFVRGEGWKFPVEISFDGRQARREDLSAIQPVLTATVRDGADEREADVRSSQEGRAEVTFDPPNTWRSSVVTVTVVLTVRTANGIDISPPALTRDVPVTTPMAITPTVLRPASVTGRGHTTSRIRVTAPKDSGGCVWLPALDGGMDDLPVPIDVTSKPAAASERTCVRLRPGTSRELAVQFDVQRGNWSGIASGSVVMMTRLDGTDPVATEIPVSFPLVKHTDIVRYWVVWALLGLLTLLPLLLVLLNNHVNLKRFVRPGALRTATMAVTVTPAAAGPAAVEPTAATAGWTGLEPKAPDRRSRRKLTAGNVVFRARCSRWNPFASPRTQVKVNKGRLATPAAGPTGVLDDLSLDLSGVVVASTGATDTTRPFDAEVAIVVGGHEGLLGERLDAVRDAAVAAARRLVSRASDNDQEN